MTSKLDDYEIQYDDEVCVAFLDLLGFKYFVNENIDDATDLLRCTHEIFQTKLNNDKLFPPEKYPNKSLAKLAEKSGIRSFKSAIPFSDSLILVSSDPSLFAVQLAHFIIDSFNYNSHVYNDIQGGNPMEVNIPSVEKTEEGKIKVTDERKRWYPTLFRGGVSFGKIRFLRSQYYMNGKTQVFPNVVGIPFMEAYLYEGGGGRGPRLFCHPSFVNKLDSYLHRYIVPVETIKIKNKVYELVWPALLFNEDNNPEVEVNGIPELLRPIQVLANYFKTGDAHEQYVEFIKLISRGALLFFRNQSKEHLAIEKISSIIAKEILEEIPEWPREKRSISFYIQLIIRKLWLYIRRAFKFITRILRL